MGRWNPGPKPPSSGGTPSDFPPPTPQADSEKDQQAQIREVPVTASLRVLPLLYTWVLEGAESAAVSTSDALPLPLELT